MSLSELYMHIFSDKWQVPLNLSKEHLNHDIPAHWHEYPEFLYVVDGECRMTIGASTFNAKPGDLLCSSPNELHSLKCVHHECCFECLLIKPSFMLQAGLSHTSFSGFLSSDTIVIQIFNELRSAFDSSSSERACRIMGNAHLLLAHLIKIGQTRPYTPESLKSEAQVKEIIQYISDHYYEKLSTQALAEKAFLNESYFCRLFKSYTGMSPLSYLNHHRAMRAAVLLKETSDSITSIALSVGFSDPTYFGRVFFECFSLTPTEYRRKNKV